MKSRVETEIELRGDILGDIQEIVADLAEGSKEYEKFMKAVEFAQNRH